MKPFWVQAAAGALVGAVVAGLAFVPGRLLGPVNHARPLSLPATVQAQAVHMSLPKPKPVVRHVAKKQIGAPVAQLAAVQPVTPVVTPARIVHKPKPVRHAAAKPKPLVSPKRVAHPRQPKETLAPKPPPATPPPAATATVTATLDPTPPAPTEVAAPAVTTTSSAPATPPPPPADNRDHGHSHDHHGHGHGHNG